MAEIISPKNVNKFIVWLFMPWKVLKAFSESGTTLGTPGICDSPGNPWNYSGLPWEPFESGTPLGTHGIRDSLGNPWNWVLSWLPLEFVTPLGTPGIRDSSGHPLNSVLPWEPLELVTPLGTPGIRDSLGKTLECPEISGSLCSQQIPYPGQKALSTTLAGLAVLMKHFVCTSSCMSDTTWQGNQN